MTEISHVPCYPVSLRGMVSQISNIISNQKVHSDTIKIKNISTTTRIPHFSLVQLNPLPSHANLTSTPVSTIVPPSIIFYYKNSV
jgi:hypothetical protein